MGSTRSTFGRILIGCSLTLAIVVSLSAGLVVGLRYEPPLIVASTPAERAALNLKVFDAVWTRVDREYYDQSFGGRDWKAIRDHYRPMARSSPDAAGLYYEVLTPMLNTLGSSHVGASPPKTKRLFSGRTSNRPRILATQRKQSFGYTFIRTGLTFAYVDGHQAVADVRNHSPAEKAGIEPGWRVLALRTLPRSHEVAFVFAQAGRGGKPVEIILAEDMTTSPRMPYGLQALPSGPVVLRFDNFDQVTIDWVLAQFDKAPAAGVILDLRGNHGGSVIQNRRLMDALLRPGSPTEIEIERNGRHTLQTPEDSQTYDGPLAILIGPASASSAEVVASAVRWNRRGPIAGQRSAGALLTARRWRLPDGGRVTVAIQDFRAPDGQRIENVGVPPTIPASKTLATIRQDRDLVIEAAEDALTRRH